MTETTKEKRRAKLYELCLQMWQVRDDMKEMGMSEDSISYKSILSAIEDMQMEYLEQHTICTLGKATFRATIGNPINASQAWT